MRATLLRVAVVVAAVFAVAAAEVRTARADAPVITRRTFEIPLRVSPNLTQQCGIPIFNEITLDRTIIAFFDEDGRLVRRITHDSFEGTQVVGLTGAAFPWRGTYTTIYDADANTTTIVGLRQEIRLDADAPLAMQAGRIVLGGTGVDVTDVLFETPHADFLAYFRDFCVGIGA